jgi:hypothetical protein
MAQRDKVMQQPDPEIEREVTILAVVHDALAWRHITEPVADIGKRVSRRTVIYHAEAEGLTGVLSARDCRAGPRDVLWCRLRCSQPPLGVLAM